MTTRGNIRFAFLLAVLLLVWGSCTRLEPQTGGERGVVSLTFVTSDSQTRAPSGDPIDGGGISVDGSGNPDLAIVLANSSGDLVAWYPDGFLTEVSMGDDYSPTCETEHTPSTDATASTISFSGLPRNTYTVFAFANKAGLPSSVLTSLRACESVSDLEALQLSVDSGQPDFGSKMPLTARTSISVNASGNGQVDVSLLRPVARVNITFRNQTGEEIDIHACTLTIGDMNPSYGYLLPRATDYVSGHDRDLVISAAGPLVFGSDPLVPAEYNRSTLHYVQVFPSVAPARAVGRRYLCSISFRVTKAGKVYDAGDDTTYDSYEFTDLPVHDSYSADIQYLRRNQFLKIETRITKRAAEFDYSFNFEVQSWVEKVNYVTFD